MDSLSQIVLGAAVSIAVFRRKQPLWQSAALGAVVGTLPDLDVLISHGDPISDMTYHRTESHALFYLTLVSPLLAWLWLKLSRSAGSFRHSFWHSFWYSLLAIWLVLITHPLLDALTIYGTQLGLPFTDTPVGTGSVFVIDPLYTLPLLLGIVLVLAGRRLVWNSLGLLLSTAYLGFGLVAQQQVTTLARQQLPPVSPAAQLQVTATPFNTVLWRLLLVDGDHYYEAFYSLLDDTAAIRWQSYPRGLALLQQYQHDAAVARLHWFANGFVSLQPLTGALQLTDLRMGLEPGYSFRFQLPLNKAGVPAGEISQSEFPRNTAAWFWLYRRASGQTDQSLAQWLATSRTEGQVLSAGQ